jgi:hypothetical protein
MPANNGPARLSIFKLLTQLRLFSKTCGPMMAEPTERTTPPSNSSTVPANWRKSSVRRPANGRAVEHGMVGNDVVADARMDRQRNVVAESFAPAR